MNFAPYQDESPEVERALSPPPLSGADLASRTASPQLKNPVQGSTPALYNAATNSRLQHPVNGGPRYHDTGRTDWASSVDPESQRQQQRDRNDAYGGARADLGAFETSLPLRVDYEAMLAYLLLPPAGGVFLLLFEHKSDYVR